MIETIDGKKTPDSRRSELGGTSEIICLHKKLKSHALSKVTSMLNHRSKTVIQIF